jgi:hypothetical protein
MQARIYLNEFVEKNVEIPEGVDVFYDEIKTSFDPSGAPSSSTSKRHIGRYKCFAHEDIASVTSISSDKLVEGGSMYKDYWLDIENNLRKVRGEYYIEVDVTINS